MTACTCKHRGCEGASVCGELWDAKLTLTTLHCLGEEAAVLDMPACGLDSRRQTDQGNAGVFCSGLL